MSDSPAVRLYTMRDAIPHALAGERVAVLGYGNLGRAFALNLRDSGVIPLVVGNIVDDYYARACDEAFTVMPIGEAVASSDVVFILLPDEVIPQLFERDIALRAAPGSAVIFASGYALAYGLVEPPAGIDVLLLAPRMGGEIARERYLAGRGFFAYASVEQDASGTAQRRLLGIAEAVGVLRSGALELSARIEADLDLFIEQSLGATIGVAIMAAFSAGVEAGIPPEAMVMEMYMDGEMETVFRGFRQDGFFGSSEFHGPTALFGGFMRTLQLTQADLATHFQEILAEIQDGTFARQFQAEERDGYPMLAQARSLSAGANPIVEAETNVRALLASKRAQYDDQDDPH
jgi:ketol-acid reductoisomerase